MGSWVSAVNVMMPVMSKTLALSISQSIALNLPTVACGVNAVKIYL